MKAERRRGPLNHYQKKIPSKEDHVLFQEAVSCAESKAYRAAYVMVWLSCAESLKRRFREISSRDHLAKKIYGKIQQLESAQRSVDKYILDKAKDYGFISDADYTHLEHIYTLRCVYGHPYEEAPEREVLVAAASTVVDVVLSRPLKLREGYLSTQVKLLTEDNTFLDDVAKSVRVYAKRVFPKVDENKHGWFLEKLWEKVDPLVSDPSMALFVKRAAWFSQAYLAQDSYGPLHTRNHLDDLVRYPGILTYVLATPSLYDKLEEHPQDMVVGKILELAKKDTSYFSFLEILDKRGYLSKRAQTRFMNAIYKVEEQRLASRGTHPRYFIHRLIAGMQSHTWSKQNRAINNLLNLESEKLAELDEKVLLRVGNNILQCAEGDAAHAKDVMQNLANGKIDWPFPIILGAFEECFVNNEDKVRFKTAFVFEATLAMTHVPKRIRNDFIVSTANRVKAGTWSGWFDEEERNAAIKELARAKEKSDEKLFYLDSLIASITEKEYVRDSDDDFDA